MTPWKITLESSPDMDPDSAISTIPVSDVRKFVTSTVGPLNDLVRGVFRGYFNPLAGVLKKVERTMRGDMVVKASVGIGDKSFPDVHIRITGDET